jgi:hypothetical protein
MSRQWRLSVGRSDINTDLCALEQFVDQSIAIRVSSMLRSIERQRFDGSLPRAMDAFVGSVVSGGTNHDCRENDCDMRPGFLRQ